jgi:glucan phosphorylase
MMNAKTKAIPLALTVAKELVKLVSQNGCGPIQFVGTDNALYDRHLLFDNIVALTGPSPHTAILNVAGTGELPSDHTIAEYAAGIWKVEPCPVH